MRAWVLPVMTARAGVTAWIVDDTSFPKKGRHSVGVARQYSGQLGKRDNCQVAVSLSVATAEASLPIARQLYLAEVWVGDGERRAKAKVPEEVTFQTKQQFALGQVTAARAAGVPAGVVLADAFYGNSSAFRDGLSELGLDFVVAVLSKTAVSPLERKWRGRGRRPTRLRRTAG